MDAGLTTIAEADIEKHRATAQSFITRIVVLEDADSKSGTALAGTGRRFISPVSTGGLSKTREVELTRTVQSITPDDALMGIGQHALLYRARRGIQIALAVADQFAKGNDLESLAAKNARAPLEGEEQTRFKKLLNAQAYVAAFTLATYLAQTIDSTGEAPNDIAEPAFNFDTAQDAVKSLIAGLDRALQGSKDDGDLTTRA
ncbi:AAA family ATPase, partial [Salmonella enterica subsp. enterica]|nr:AAA family ATPase [Salmonella enterica subsp. enterica serovar Enteritidis]